MKKVLKHLFSAVIITFFCFTMMFIADAAKKDIFTYKVSDGQATIEKIDCFELTELVIPSELGGYPVTTLDKKCVENGYGIKSISIPDSLVNIPVGTFKNCNAVEKVTVNPDNKYFSTVDGNLFNKKKTKLLFYCRAKTQTEYTVPSGVTVIEDYAFHSSYKLTNVVIPDSVKRIDADAFGRCSNLKNITNASGVQKIGSRAFYSCDLLESIDFTNELIDIGYAAFSDCSSLKNIVIPESVTNIGGSAFSGCDKLTDVIISEGVTKIKERTFEFCVNLRTIVIPDSVKSIGSAAFWGCHNLKNINIPYGVTFIGSGAFYYCYLLTSMVIPEGVDSIRSKTFGYCKNLQSIILPDSVKSIGDAAFWRCEKLEYVLLGKGVKTIGAKVFYDCPLKEVYYNGTQGQLMQIEIDSTNTQLLNAQVYVMKCTQHSFTKYTSDKNATYLKDGTKTAYCDNLCGAKDTKTDKGSKLKLGVTSKITAKQSTSSITLTWKKVPAATGYAIYRYDSDKKKYVKIATVEDATTYKNTGLTAGKIYKYKVKAYKKYSDGKTVWGTMSSAFSTATKCKTPSITSLTSTKGKANAKWSNVVGETGYELYYSTSKTGTYKKAASYEGNVVKGSKSNLSSNKTYYFKVRAFKEVNDQKIYSAWSSVKSVKIK